MFDYLQKFNNLPRDLRNRVSSPAVMTVISELEKKYQVDLAMLVMKVMIKSVPAKNLAAYLVSDAGLDPTKAQELERELLAQVFKEVAAYLGLEREARSLEVEADIEDVVKEAGLSIASVELIGRLRNIISTYIRGVRSKIDARDTLMKPVIYGGLNLSREESERVFLVTSRLNLKSLGTKPISAPTPIPAPAAKLDRIIAAAEAEAAGAYDLKKAIAAGQVKPLAPAAASIPAASVTPSPKVAIPAAPVSPAKTASQLDLKHEIEAPDMVGALSAPQKPAVAAISPLPKAASTIPAAAPVAPKVFVPIIPKIAPAAIPNTPVVPIAPKAEAVIKNVERENKEVKEEKVINEKKEEKSAAVALKTAPQKPAEPAPKVMATPRPPVAAIRPQPVSQSPSKPLIRDVKPMPKVMGPIEELQFLDIVNFRRLGQTPADITAKIFSKIKLLEGEGYDKMVAGVMAWRKSPVNLAYIKMSGEAMRQGMKLKDYAAAKAGNRDYLTWDEIEALLALNSRLVF